VYVIGHELLGHDLPAALGGDLLQQLLEPAGDPRAQDPAPILQAPHHMQAPIPPTAQSRLSLGAHLMDRMTRAGDDAVGPPPARGGGSDVGVPPTCGGRRSAIE
jgi:hypothetical protein